MLMTALFLGGILIFAGLATYVFAPRVGPNPIFGVRIGYAYASRDIWNRTNRVGGMLFILVGIGVAIFGLMLQWLNFPPRDGIGMMTAAMLITLLGGTVWLFFYARNLAQGSGIARELVPVKFRWLYIAPVIITFAALVLFALYVYPQLPAERVPSHFNIHDQPDGWQSRNEFLLTFLGMSALFVVLNAVIVFIAIREPMVAFSRWGNRWQMDPGRGLIFAGLAFAFVNLIFIALLWNIWWLVTRGTLAFTFWWILWLTLPFIGGIIALFFRLARRTA